MTKNITLTPAPLNFVFDEDDPRFGFATVLTALDTLIDETTSDMLTNSTPCPAFDVKQLLEHCVLVVRRVAAIGRGEHWSTISAQPTDSGWIDDYRSGCDAVAHAWSDPAVLAAILEVPWGELPGAWLMNAYAAELAVHSWDLAQATDRTLVIDDDVLGGALTAAKFIPVEGRATDEVPFSAVVDPGPAAPVLDQIAGWMGRNVLARG